MRHSMGKPQNLKPPMQTLSIEFIESAYGEIHQHNAELQRIVNDKDQVCPVCNDQGFIIHLGRLIDCPKQSCDAASELKQNRQYRMTANMASLTNRRDRALAYDFEEYHRIADNPFRQAALTYAAEFVDNLSVNIGGYQKSCLMFCGNTGTGKTSLASAIINELEMLGYNAMFFRVEDVIAAVQSTYNTNQSSDQMIRYFAETEILAMDEFDVETMSSDKRRIIESIIDHRTRDDLNILPTIATTNLDQGEFINRWGERTGDRALHAFHWIMIQGKIRNQNPIWRP